MAKRKLTITVLVESGKPITPQDWDVFSEYLRECTVDSLNAPDQEWDRILRPVYTKVSVK